MCVLCMNSASPPRIVSTYDHYTTGAEDFTAAASLCLRTVRCRDQCDCITGVEEDRAASCPCLRA
eukprot:1153412-Pelagomonas_calceolata.AAC.6